MDSFKAMDGWFVNLVAFGGACYFLWSIRNILTDLKDEIKELKDFINKVFNKSDDHEQRISRLEGICKGRRFGEDCEK